MSETDEILDDARTSLIKRWEVTIERKVIVYAATSEGATSHAKQWINGVGSIVGVVELSPLETEGHNQPTVDVAPVVSRK